MYIHTYIIYNYILYNYNTVHENVCVMQKIVDLVCFT